MPIDETNSVAIDRLPDGLRGDNTRRWLTLYTDRLDSNQAIVTAQIDGLLVWDQDGSIAPANILPSIGRLLSQPRPSGATDDEYRRILRIRRVVRLSKGTAPDIRKVVAAIGDEGAGAIVYFSTPHIVIVTFANFASQVARGLTIDVVASLLIDAIGDVDRLQIWDAVANPFTWDLENFGWLQAVWALPLFDSED